MLVPQLLRARNRLYLLLLPILLALFAANLMYYHGIATGNDLAQAWTACAWRSTPSSCSTCSRAACWRRSSPATPCARKAAATGAVQHALEIAAVGAVLLLAACDLGAAPRPGPAAAALACALLHGWRCARWQGWRVADVPLVLVMHLGFAWLVLAFALKAAAELTGLVPEAAWLHAFTVGSLGLMMLGLMTRVSLRHTGRPLVVPGAMLVAYALMFVAALLRLAATVHGLGSAVIALSAGCGRPPSRSISWCSGRRW
jgi:uncharacterized protein involved in response to NO